MASKNITINKTVGINFFSLILLQGISFFTAPIFLRMLGSEQYGVFAVFSSHVSILSCFMGLGASGGIAVSKYDFPDQYYEFRSSNLLLGTFLSLGIVLIAAIFIQPLSNLFKLSKTFSLLVFLTAFSLFICSFASGAFVYEKKPISNLVSSLSVAVLNIGISFLFIWLLDESERYTARILGYALSHILVALVLWLIVFLKKPTWLNMKFNKYSLRIGFPMIFHTLSNTVLIQSDRIMMQHMQVSSSDIGIYTAYYSLASILTSVLSALNTSWCPYYYDDLKNENWDGLKTKTRRYLEFFTVLTCGFILLSREVALAYAGREYAVGINILPIITIATFFIFMYQFPVNFEMFHKKTRIVAIGTIGAAAGNILLNYFGIKQWGMFGAAIATVLAYLLLFIVHYCVAHRMKEQKFHVYFREYLPWLVLSLLVFSMFYWLADFWYIRWALGAAIGLIEFMRIKKRRSLF